MATWNMLPAAVPQQTINPIANYETGYQMSARPVFEKAMQKADTEMDRLDVNAPDFYHNVSRVFDENRPTNAYAREMYEGYRQQVMDEAFRAWKGRAAAFEMDGATPASANEVPGMSPSPDMGINEQWRRGYAAQKEAERQQKGITDYWAMSDPMGYAKANQPAAPEYAAAEGVIYDKGSGTVKQVLPQNPDWTLSDGWLIDKTGQNQPVPTPDIRPDYETSVLGDGTVRITANGQLVNTIGSPYQEMMEIDGPYGSVLLTPKHRPSQGGGGGVPPQAGPQDPPITEEEVAQAMAELKAENPNREYTHEGGNVIGVSEGGEKVGEIALTRQQQQQGGGFGGGNTEVAVQPWQGLAVDKSVYKHYMDQYLMGGEDSIQAKVFNMQEIMGMIHELDRIDAGDEQGVKRFMAQALPVMLAEKISPSAIRSIPEWLAKQLAAEEGTLPERLINEVWFFLSGDKSDAWKEDTKNLLKRVGRAKTTEGLRTFAHVQSRSILQQRPGPGQYGENDVVFGPPTDVVKTYNFFNPDDAVQIPGMVTGGAPAPAGGQQAQAAPGGPEMETATQTIMVDGEEVEITFPRPKQAPQESFGPAIANTLDVPSPAVPPGPASMGPYVNPDAPPPPWQTYPQAGQRHYDPYYSQLPFEGIGQMFQSGAMPAPITDPTQRLMMDEFYRMQLADDPALLLEMQGRQQRDRSYDWNKPYTYWPHYLQSQ